jgi:NitT/TauT family transport system substrate-binding protein
MRRLLTLLLVPLALLSACGEDSPTGQPSEPTELTKVRLILGFAPSGTESYWYLAREKGFFRERGLDLEIIPGESSSTSVASVASGSVDFANADLASLIFARGEDPDTAATMVAAIHARAPYTVFSLESGANIQDPEDLDGATIGLPSTSTNDELMKVWADKVGVSGFDFKGVDPSVQNQLFLSGRIESILSFLTSEHDLETGATEEGEKLVSLPLADYGLDDFYGNSLMVNDAFAEENPETVSRFVEAYLEGIEYAFDHPEEAAANMQTEFPTILEESTVGRLELLEQLATDGGALDRVGGIEPEKVASTVDYVTEGSPLANPVDPETLYTTEFLPDYLLQ